MHPQLPLPFPTPGNTSLSVTDIHDCLDHIFVEALYGDKVYLHNTFATYTYNSESLILVDTSVPREVRLPQAVSVKQTLIIKDITGQASTNPILISLIGDDVNVQGSETKEFQIYVNYGSMFFTANTISWTVGGWRPTSMSYDAFRQPKNLNFILPPAGPLAPVQLFPSIVYFPNRMVGKDAVIPGFNGLTVSTYKSNQIEVQDPVNSSLVSL